MISFGERCYSNQYDEISDEEFSDDEISGFANTTKFPTTKFLAKKNDTRFSVHQPIHWALETNDRFFTHTFRRPCNQQTVPLPNCSVSRHNRK